MDITTCRVISFSPTGTSRKVAEAVASGLGLPVVLSDMTKAAERETPPATGVNDDADTLTILCAPVYYGRVAKTAAKMIATLKGRNRPIVIIANYGNRHYDDALLELMYLVRGSGFVPVAAAAFVSEHSFSSKQTPLAAGRPDGADISKAAEFGKALAARLTEGTLFKRLKKVPGNAPYKAYPDAHRMLESDENCTKCGECVAACPVDAITINDEGLHTDEQACILCQACVKICPEGARRDPAGDDTRTKLAAITAERREPEIFFPE